ncbi:unnamed protein product [Durusdinium trenchii]|uniref:Fe2OG dioxygenase domain-containing protein n=1 Tax=Durusdinium trenchii TaxID=1381693 RepID=A0ABP0PQJ2_9DINO
MCRAPQPPRTWTAAVLTAVLMSKSGMTHSGFLWRQAFSRSPAVQMRVRERARVNTDVSLESPLDNALKSPWFPQRKPLPERLVRLGHCLQVPALGSPKQDHQLAHLLLADIQNEGKHLRMHRSKRHQQIWGEHLKGSKTFTAVVARLVSLFGMSMVDCWVNVYRNGLEEKSPHHDNYKDRAPRPSVTLGLSLGSPRDMLFKDRWSGEEFRVEQRNGDPICSEQRSRAWMCRRPIDGDVFAFDTCFNNQFTHAIPSSREDGSGLRLSIIVWATAGQSLAVPQVIRKGPGFPVEEVVKWSDWDLTDGLWSDSSALAGDL